MIEEEKRELYREGEVVEVEKTEKGYAIGVKDNFVIEFFFSDKPINKGARVKVYRVYGGKNLKSRFEIVICD